MTKKQTIKWAMVRLRKGAQNGLAPLPVAVEEEIARAYELGRIVGLREAEKIVDPPPDSPCVSAEEYAVASDWLNAMAVQIRKHANKLAKKARKHAK